MPRTHLKNPKVMALFLMALSVLSGSSAAISWTAMSPILTTTGYGLGTRFIYAREGGIALRDRITSSERGELLGTVNCSYFREFVRPASRKWSPWKQREKSFVSVTLKPGASIDEKDVVREFRHTVAAGALLPHFDVKYPHSLGSTSPEFIWWEGFISNAHRIWRWMGMALAVIFLVIAWPYVVIIQREQVRIAKRSCAKCGYDLRGDLAGGCPECGWNRAASA